MLGNLTLICQSELDVNRLTSIAKRLRSPPDWALNECIVSLSHSSRLPIGRDKVLLAAPHFWLTAASLS